MTTIAADAVSEISDRLEKFGFERRQAAGIFTMELADGVLAWLGLNRASKRLGGDAVEFNPVVGVRHQEVERIVSELRGEKFHRFVPPTVSQPIGYVMPEQRYVAWLFERASIVVRADDLASAVEAHALPVLRPLVDLAAVLRAADERWGFAHQLVYRRPVIRWLLGDEAEALAALDAALDDLGDRSDAAAVELRSFGSAFRAWASRGGWS